MIQANELRIGNYVQGNPISINRMQVKSDGVIKVTGYGINLIELDVNNSMMFTSIPLTENWLLKFGFTKETDNNGFEFYMLGSYIQTDLNNTIWFGNNEFNIKEVPVHRMQNLFFSLTGSELVLSTVPVSSLSEQ